MTWTHDGPATWLVVLVLAAWLVPKRWQTAAIALVSAGFLAVTSAVSLGLLVGLGCLSYALGRGGRQKGWRPLSVVLAVAGALIFFKHEVRLGDLDGHAIVPLGLAYYGLRIIHYAVGSYQGRLPPHGLLDYLRYLLFFPTLIAGPINRFEPFHRDSKRRRWDRALFATGLERILCGYVKIVALGNYLVVLRFGGWLQNGGPEASWLAAYLACVQYGANLYLQFSGYSDVAIGLAMLVGFRIEENFRWPFLARNINDFWRRWHITLSGWCRDFVFSPVAASTRNPYLAVVASMLVLGLWHELSVRYLVWGATHGAAIAIWQAFQALKRRFPARIPKALRPVLVAMSWALTIQVVILSFTITSSSSLAEAWHLLTTILCLGWGGDHV